jgi:CRP-like cAMP-binding protein
VSTPTLGTARRCFSIAASYAPPAPTHVAPAPDPSLLASPAEALPAAANRLLAALAARSPADAAWLAPHLEPVNLGLGAVLAPAGEPFTHAYFPQTAVISVICRMANGGATEVGTIGNEGMVDVAVFLGASPNVHETIAQIPGAALRVPAKLFSDGVDARPALRRLLNRYTLAYLAQVAQTAACNRLHHLEARCARWLLMTHDRVGRAERFALTQEYLGVMLGVRRAGVTVAAGALQDAGLIRYRRGGIRVLDREGLEAAACECYGVVHRQFDRLLQ